MATTLTKPTSVGLKPGSKNSQALESIAKTGRDSKGKRVGLRARVAAQNITAPTPEQPQPQQQEATIDYNAVNKKVYSPVASTSKPFSPVIPPYTPATIPVATAATQPTTGFGSAVYKTATPASPQGKSGAKPNAPLSSDRTSSPQNTVEASPERKPGVLSRLNEKANFFETQRINAPSRSFQEVGYYGLELVSRTPQSVLDFGKYVKNTFTDPSSDNSVFGTGRFYKKTAIESKGNPITFVDTVVLDPFRERPGKAGADLLAGFIIGKAGGKAFDVGKNQYVKLGADFVEPENVFSKQVLVEGKTFPLATSTPQALKTFNAGRIPAIEISNVNNIPSVFPTQKVLVNTASPKAISGNVVGKGSKGGLPVPLEDPGIYVSAKGEGSPAFLRVSADTPTEYSLNPFSGLKDAFGVPTVTEFSVNKVLKQPRGVVNQPGFGGVSSYLESQGGSGNAFITKRSELGQGSVARQTFASPVDFESPFPRTVTRNGNVIPGVTKIKAGDFLREAGTSELEAVIPPGTSFGYSPQTFSSRVKGFDKYTTFNGRSIAIREADVFTTNTPAASFPKNTRSISSTQIMRETDMFSRVSSSPRSISRAPITSISFKNDYEFSVPKQSSIPKGSSRVPRYSDPFGYSSTVQSSRTSRVSRQSSFTSRMSRVSAPKSVASNVSAPRSALSAFSKVSSPVSQISAVSAPKGGRSGLSFPRAPQTRVSNTWYKMSSKALKIPKTGGRYSQPRKTQYASSPAGFILGLRSTKRSRSSKTKFYGFETRGI